MTYDLWQLEILQVYSTNHPFLLQYSYTFFWPLDYKDDSEQRLYVMHLESVNSYSPDTDR